MSDFLLVSPPLQAQAFMVVPMVWLWGSRLGGQRSSRALIRAGQRAYVATSYIPCCPSQVPVVRADGHSYHCTWEPGHTARLSACSSSMAVCLRRVVCSVVVFGLYFHDRRVTSK
jgi:hypothetical protein